MKKTISLLLALVMCIGLGVPAFAAPVDALDPNATGSVESPQYAVYEMPFRAYAGGLTYIDMAFTVSYKGGNYAFESLDSVSFTPMDPNGLYWKLTKYTYQLSSTSCTVNTWRTEMIGNTPTGFSDTASYTVSINDVVGNARESGSAIASSVSVVVEETYGFRMTAEEFISQVATSGIESVTRVPMRRAD